MKKTIGLLTLAVGGGIVGLLLRRWQLATVYNPETELFRSGQVASFVLLAFLALLTIAFVLLCRNGTAPNGYEDAFLCPNVGYMSLMAASAMLFLVASMLKLLEVMDAYALWKMDPTRNLLPIMPLISALLCIPAAGAVLMLGRGHYRGVLPRQYRGLSTMPAYAALPWLVSVYQENSKAPALLSYVYRLMGVVFLLLALYYVAAYAYERAHPVLMAVCALLGISLSILSLGDGLSRGELVLTCAFLLVVLGDVLGLLGNCFGRPHVPKRLADRMPRGANMEDEGSTTLLPEGNE